MQYLNIYIYTDLNYLLFIVKNGGGKMSFYEEYVRYANKEQFYFADNSLSDFNRLVDSIKKQMIHDGLISPSFTKFKLNVNKDSYPKLFTVLNDYEYLKVNKINVNSAIIKRVK